MSFRTEAQARAVMASAAKAAWADPAHRAAVCAKLKAAAQRPDVRAKRLAAACKGGAAVRDALEQAVERRYQAAMALIQRRRREQQRCV